MKISSQLFEGQFLRMSAIDPDQDPQVEVNWTYDLEYAQKIIGEGPVHPLTIFELKKQYEEWQKGAEEKRDQFYFGFHLREDDRLIGFMRVPWVAWTSGDAFLQVDIGDPEMQSRYGAEAMSLALNYLFQELNVFRVGMLVPEYNPVEKSLCEEAGFVLEVIRRQSCYREGRRWDRYLYGLLQFEFIKGLNEEEK
jgi:RimJ/RimL family protein N-acetyltransferase